MEPLSRTSWKIKAEPQRRTSLGFEATFDAEEVQQIRSGVLPQAMEDKWFIFSEGEWTYFCRSWTGAFVYGLRIAGDDKHRVVESWVNRDPEEYAGTDIDYDRALLQFLIDAFLLRKPAVFPVPRGMSELAPGIYQHGAIGRAYPEVAYDRPARGIWARIRHLLGLRTNA